MEKQFNYVIGCQYEDGSIGTYLFHNQDIYYGSLEDAKRALAEVKEQSKRDVEWKIFVVSELED